MPKSSASRSVSTSAAQLIATNGPWHRRLRIVNLARDQLLADAALAFEQHREVRVRDALDRRTQRLHRGRRSNERRRAVPPGARADQRAGPRQLQTIALDLEDEGADVRRQPKHLKVPLAEPGPGIEGRLQHAGRRGVRPRHFERDRFGPGRRGSLR